MNVASNFPIQFSDIFQEEPQNIDYYLKNISRKTILKASAHFLGYYNTDSKYGNYVDFLINYFQRDNEEFYTYVRDGIERIRTENPNRIIRIVNPLASLKLFEYAFEQSKDFDEPKDFDTIAFEINFLKSYLLINEEINNKKREKQELLNVGEYVEKINKNALVIGLPEYDLVTHKLEIVFTCQLIKAKYLFDFIESNNNTSFLLKKILAYYSVHERSDIFKHMIELASACITRTEGGTQLIVSEDEHHDESCFFLDTLIISTSMEDVDFKQVRDKPLYKEDRNSYRIIYPFFALEKIYKSWYFTLNALNNQHQIEKEKIIEFRSFYGEHFTEDYLLHRILNKTFNSRYTRLTGSGIRAKFGNIAEPDYYARLYDDIYIFESKDTYLKAEVKTSYNFDLIEDDLKNKLYFKQNKSKITKKAVLQVVNNIEKILKKTIEFDSIKNPQKANIYSIIFLHDESFNTPGLNYIINKWFINEIRSLQRKGLQIYRIRPVVIITVDTMIILNGSLNSGYFSFKNLLNEYCDKYLESTNSTKNKKQNGISISFSDHVKNLAKKNNVKLMPSYQEMMRVGKDLTGLST